MLNKLCLQFNSMRAGSGSGCRKFSELFLVLCAIILFIATPVQVVEAASVSFSPTWRDSTFTFVPEVSDSLASGIYEQGSGTGTYYTYNSNWFYYSGTVTCSSAELLQAGYTYGGNMNVGYTITSSFVGGVTHDLQLIGNHCYVTRVEVLIDGAPKEAFLGSSALSGDFWFPFSNTQVSTSATRMQVRFYVRGMALIATSRASIATAVIPRVDLKMVLTTKSASITGKSEGFNDNINSFDQSMDAGSSAENNLTDTALDHINGYEFSDLSSGAGMASALSFYSSVVMAGYTSLGDFKQLFGIVFALIIIVVILRIRRDSS